VSRSACFTHSFSVWPVQPILAAIDRIVAQRDGCCASCSSTIRTTRSRTSGENLFVVLLFIALPSQGLELPVCRGSPRFRGALPWRRERMNNLMLFSVSH
jgi:hypothetical protein